MVSSVIIPDYWLLPGYFGEAVRERWVPQSLHFSANEKDLLWGSQKSGCPAGWRSKLLAHTGPAVAQKCDRVYKIVFLAPPSV